MSDCVCKKLQHWLDAVAMDYRRKDCVVVYNRTTKIIETCPAGHVVSFGETALVDPNFPAVSRSIEAKDLKIEAQFDWLGNQIRSTNSEDMA